MPGYSPAPVVPVEQLLHGLTAVATGREVEAIARGHRELPQDEAALEGDEILGDVAISGADSDVVNPQRPPGHLDCRHLLDGGVAGCVDGAAGQGLDLAGDLLYR